MSEEHATGLPPPDQVTIYSNEVHEILTYVPNWLIRWGTTIVFLSVAMLIGLSWMIQYPDVVKGRLKVSAKNPPVDLVSRVSGPINFIIEDTEAVQEGQIIGFISHSASYDDVKKLKKQLKAFNPNVRNTWGNFDLIGANQLVLGEIQPYVSNLVTSLKQHRDLGTKAMNNNQRKQFIINQIAEYEQKNRQLEQQKATLKQLPSFNQSQASAGQAEQKKSIIRKQIEEFKLINQNLAQQIRLQEQEYRRIYDAYTKRYKPLYEKGGLAKAKLEEYEGMLTQQKRTIEGTKASINQNNSQILSLQRQLVEIDDLRLREELQERENDQKEQQRNQLEQMQLLGAINENNNQILALKRQLAELDFNQTDQSINVETELATAYNSLVNQVNLWEDSYLVEAPIAGKLTYLAFIKNRTFVNAAEPIATVVPDSTSGKLNGEMYIPALGSGKVEEGQVVQISFDNYLKKEYGTVKGKVLSITPFTKDGNYMVRVDLENGLTTTFHKQLTFSHDMQGDAEIITQKKRLIERIFNEIMQVFRSE